MREVVTVSCHVERLRLINYNNMRQVMYKGTIVRCKKHGTLSTGSINYGWSYHSSIREGGSY